MARVVVPLDDAPLACAPPFDGDVLAARLRAAARVEAAERQRLLGAYAMHAAAVLHRRALLDLAESADTLARDNKARTALLSAVSHDLRTPLAGIKAAVGSLRSGEVTFSPEDQAELLEAVETSADRLDALIGNLLDASRLQTGALVANPREIDLAEVVTPAVRALETPDRVTWHLDDAARHLRHGPLGHPTGPVHRDPRRRRGADRRQALDRRDRR